MKDKGQQTKKPFNSSVQEFLKGFLTNAFLMHLHFQINKQTCEPQQRNLQIPLQVI